MTQRERFEAWAKSVGYEDVSCDRLGEYYFQPLQAAWEAWQAAVAAESARRDAEETIWRRLVALAYAGSVAYWDDGEMQDSTEQPWIDFKRDSATEIDGKIMERGVARFRAAQEGIEIKEAPNG